MPAFQAEYTIGAAIESILNQTYSNFKLLIIDDASTDNTIEVARKYQSIDNRVKVIKNEQNLGGYGNYNKSLDNCSGDYCCIYHADDYYEMTILEKSVMFLEANNNSVVVFTAAKEKRHYIPEEIIKERDRHRCYQINEIIGMIMKYYNFLATSSACMRSEIVIKHNIRFGGDHSTQLVQKGLKTSGDLAMWLQMLKYGCVGIIDEELIVVGDSKSRWSRQEKIRFDDDDFIHIVSHYLFNRNFIKSVSFSSRIGFDLIKSKSETIRYVKGNGTISHSIFSKSIINLLFRLLFTLEYRYILKNIKWILYRAIVSNNNKIFGYFINGYLSRFNDYVRDQY